MMNNTPPKPRELVKEGMAEARDKIKSDISRWTRVRRIVSLNRMVGCNTCDASGKVACFTCEGTGTQRMVWNEEQMPCPTCEGKAEMTCSDCAGRRLIPNPHRKKLLWVLGLGGAAWAFLLFRFWGGDVLPEQKAKYISGGGGGGVAATHVRAGGRGTRTRGEAGAARTPGGGAPERPNGPPPGGGQTGSGQ